MSAADQEWTPKARPMSVVAINFASSLDDLFNLGPVNELKDSVEQRSRELSELDAQLRRADEQLKKLDTKYKRMSRQFPGRYNMADLFTSDYGHSSSSDTDDLSSPRDDEDAHRRSLQRLEESAEQQPDVKQEQTQERPVQQQS